MHNPARDPTASDALARRIDDRLALKAAGSERETANQPRYCPGVATDKEGPTLSALPRQLIRRRPSLPQTGTGDGCEMAGGERAANHAHNGRFAWREISVCKRHLVGGLGQSD